MRNMVCDFLPEPFGAYSQLEKLANYKYQESWWRLSENQKYDIVDMYRGKNGNRDIFTRANIMADDYLEEHTWIDGEKNRTNLVRTAYLLEKNRIRIEPINLNWIFRVSEEIFPSKYFGDLSMKEIAELSKCYYSERKKLCLRLYEKQKNEFERLGVKISRGI
jgi:hypothetical protein